MRQFKTLKYPNGDINMEPQKYAVAYFQEEHPYLTSGKPYKIKHREMECFNIIDDDKDDILILADGYSAHLYGKGIYANFEIKTLEEIYMDQRENVDGRCPLCGEDEAITTGKQTFAGTRDEPAEYKLECHKCGYDAYDIDWVDGYETFEEWQERTGYYEEQD